MLDITLKKIAEPEKHKNTMSYDMPEMSMDRPSFYVNGQQMPEIKDWEVGEEYQLVVNVTMKSKNENDDKIDGRFEIGAYKHMPKKKMEDMDDKEFAEYQGKVLSTGKL